MAALCGRTFEMTIDSASPLASEPKRVAPRGALSMSPLWLW